MRILLLNNEFPPLGGGTGTVNQALLARWARVPDLEIDLITSAIGREYRTRPFDARVRLHFVPVDNRLIHHSSNRELATYTWRALAVALRLHRAKPFDLTFAWSAVPAGAVALALKRLTGLRYLLRVCGPDIPGFEKRYHALYMPLTPVIRVIWRSADRVVAKCADEEAMIHLVDAGLPVSLVANGVDTGAFMPAHIPGTGALRLLCVARLIERKGQRHVIEAVRQLTGKGVDVTLDLIGTGDAEPAYRRLVSELGLDDRVRFLGYVTREEIARYYADAHVFVLASYNEGMSVATLEAMASALPIVTTRTGGTKELVQEELNGFTFARGDVATLANHLALLASDRARAQAMGAASRARAAQFSWDAAAERYLEMFSAIESAVTADGKGSLSARGRASA